MTKLQANLNLSNNRISDIKPLSGMKKLWHLQLKQNQIMDIKPLEGLTQLLQVQLKQNPIEDMAPIQRLRRQKPYLNVDIQIDP